MNGFDLLREERVDEINAMAREYRHMKTGARILSMVTDDTNKVFGITFRTPPSDSTGVAHILEHSVLCGSRKYPVKEPFVELLKGSVQTFLNAFTYPDKTCYPVASENLKDFYNLMDVYLDAVFHPRLTNEIFQQEGWHYELENLEDPLIYKGVVYNEMKGAYSNPEDVLSELSQQVLFPHTTYGCDSGGDPKYIPDLSFRQLSDFHETLYHPSNSYIYFYGDDDPDQRLLRIAEYLDGFDARTVHSHIEEQGPLAEPARILRKYDPGEEGGKDARSMFSTNWLWPRIIDADANLALGILAYTLIGTSAGPLRKALIDSGLGEDLTGPGFASYLLQIYFGTGLRGIRSEDIEVAEKLIWSTLRTLARDGIDREILEASFNTFEFRMRESNSGGYPRGLSYMLSALNFWLYDGDPLEPLKFEGPLQRVRAAFGGDPRYFEKLIEAHFLHNTHRAVVIMEPEVGCSRREEKEEAEKLSRARQGMSRENLAEIVSNTESLVQMQETPDSPEALALIPTLAREDVSRKNKFIPIEEEHAGPASIYTHDLFTNGILYLDAAFDVTGLPQRLLPYLPLFSTALLEMGTEREDFVSLSNRIGRNTGGIGASMVCSTVRDSPSPACRLMVRGKVTLAKSRKLLDILNDVFTMSKLADRERFRQIVLEEKAEFEASIIPGGSGIADTRLRSFFSVPDWVSEQFRGVSQLFFLRSLEKRIEDDWDAISGDLLRIRELLLTRERLLLNVTLPRAEWDRIRGHVVSFIENLPATSGVLARGKWRRDASPAHEGLTIPAKVNYVAKGMSLFNQGYSLHGSVSAVTNLLRAGYLWEKVRVQGGAYGANCGMDPRSGVFSFTSYRDPNLEDTVRTYDDTGRFLRDHSLSADELTKSVIGAIGRLDAYQLPDAQGYTSMIRKLVGETETSLQQYRDQLLSTTTQDVRDFGEILCSLAKNGTVVAVGAQDTLSSASSILGAPPNLIRIL